MENIVKATYNIEYTFKIPVGVDLEDSNQVSSWWVKWNVLNIELVDGSTYQIEPFTAEDFKRPDKIEIEEFIMFN